MARMQLSKADMRKAANRLESMRTRMKNLRKKSERMTEQIVYTAEVSTMAFGMGFIQGRGGIEVLGVPLELGLGVLLNLGGWMGLGGKNAKHLNAMGTGALAAYAATLGRGVGASTGAGRTTSGIRMVGKRPKQRRVVAPSSHGMTDAELANYAAAQVG